MIHRLAALLTLPLLLLVAGCSDLNICHDGFGICKPRTKPGPNPPVVSVIELTGAAKSCSCAGARQFALHNTGGNGDVSWMTHSREPNKTTSQSESYSGPIGNKEIPFRCTIEQTESTQLCQRSTVTVWEGRPYGGDVDTILHGIVVATAKAGLQTMQELPAPSGACPQKCSNTPDCLVMDATNGKSVGVGRQIAVALAHLQPEISNSMIATLTSAKENLCQRSDVVFEGGKAYNVGLTDDCVISAKLPQTMGTLSITVPRTVSFHHTLGVGGNFDLKFDRRQASPELAFSNSVWQAVYGGRVLTIGYVAGSYVIEMEPEHRCLAVRVN